ncbi:DUF802 domain-containing protein [Ralstonia solanacearum]|uniref:DUF802 domain-containing protein n=1 Tax=Ralstonia solanacearum TaxID=305 RepID=UPI00399D7277
MPARLATTPSAMCQGWTEGLWHQDQAKGQWPGQLHGALEAARAPLEHQGGPWKATFHQWQAAFQPGWPWREDQGWAAGTAPWGWRARPWTHQGDQAGAPTGSHQRAFGGRWAGTAQDFWAGTQGQGRARLAEFSGLVQAPWEAPKPAAEFVAELRRKFSASRFRATEMRKNGPPWGHRPNLLDAEP